MRTPLQVGALTIELTLEDGRLCAVGLPAEPPAALDSATLKEILQRLEQFPLLLPTAPPFTRTVWEEMRRIPAGSALTYRELAEACGNPKAVRAVGQACGSNQLPLVVPCHRVVAETGLGGFGCGLPWKKALLELESEFASFGS